MSKAKAKTKLKQQTITKRGRPVVVGSKRQAVMAAREEKRAAGIEIKRGRPKIKQEVEA